MKVGILIKELSFNLKEIYIYYVEPLVRLGIPLEDIGAISLNYLDTNKAPATLQKGCLDRMLQSLQWFGFEILLVADPNYFKTLTKRRKVETSYGYAVACKYKGYENFVAVLSINFSALFYNPALQEKIDTSLDVVVKLIQGKYQDPGQGIIKYEKYPKDVAAISAELKKLHRYSELTCDIETFGLRVYEAGIGTIAFAWNKHEGLAFPVDILPSGARMKHLTVHTLLTHFFNTYKGKLTYHGGTFDIKILIYNLFMEHPLDRKGMLEGLEAMYRSVDDTKLISYLATNTTAGNKLKLKQQSLEFAGDYGLEEIKDITKIPHEDLLRYNLVDALATWYVKEKNYPIMVQDGQEDIYKEIFIPSMKVITQMELVGMPLDMVAVLDAEAELQSTKQKYLDVINRSGLITHFENILRTEALIDKNAKLKKKVVTMNDFLDLDYNPASNKQTRKLLYEIFEFEVIDTTDTGQPAVGAGTLNKLLNQLKLEYSITDEELE